MTGSSGNVSGRDPFPSPRAGHKDVELKNFASGSDSDTDVEDIDLEYDMDFFRDFVVLPVQPKNPWDVFLKGLKNCWKSDSPVRLVGIPSKIEQLSDDFLGSDLEGITNQEPVELPDEEGESSLSSIQTNIEKAFVQYMDEYIVFVRYYNNHRDKLGINIFPDPNDLEKVLRKRLDNADDQTLERIEPHIHGLVSQLSRVNQLFRDKASSDRIAKVLAEIAQNQTSDWFTTFDFPIPWLPIPSEKDLNSIKFNDFGDYIINEGLGKPEVEGLVPIQHLNCDFGVTNPGLPKVTDLNGHKNARKSTPSANIVNIVERYKVNYEEFVQYYNTRRNQLGINIFPDPSALEIMLRKGLDNADDQTLEQIQLHIHELVSQLSGVNQLIRDKAPSDRIAKVLVGIVQNQRVSSSEFFREDFERLSPFDSESEDPDEFEIGPLEIDHQLTNDDVSSESDSPQVIDDLYAGLPDAYDIGPGALDLPEQTNEEIDHQLTNDDVSSELDEPKKSVTVISTNSFDSDLFNIDQAGPDSIEAPVSAPIPSSQAAHVRSVSIISDSILDPEISSSTLLRPASLLTVRVLEVGSKVVMQSSIRELIKLCKKEYAAFVLYYNEHQKKLDVNIFPNLSSFENALRISQIGDHLDEETLMRIEGYFNDLFNDLISVNQRIRDGAEYHKVAKLLAEIATDDEGFDTFTALTDIADDEIKVLADVMTHATAAHFSHVIKGARSEDRALYHRVFRIVQARLSPESKEALPPPSLRDRAEMLLVARQLNNEIVAPQLTPYRTAFSLWQLFLSLFGLSDEDKLVAKFNLIKAQVLRELSPSAIKRYNDAFFAGKLEEFKQQMLSDSEQAGVLDSLVEIKKALKEDLLPVLKDWKKGGSLAWIPNFMEEAGVLVGLGIEAHFPDFAEFQRKNKEDKNFGVEAIKYVHSLIALCDKKIADADKTALSAAIAKIEALDLAQLRLGKLIGLLDQYQSLYPYEEDFIRLNMTPDKKRQLEQAISDAVGELPEAILSAIYLEIYQAHKGIIKQPTKDVEQQKAIGKKLFEEMTSTDLIPHDRGTVLAGKPRVIKFSERKTAVYRALSSLGKSLL